MTTYYDIPQGLVLSIALQEVWILQRSCPGLENVRYPHIYIISISISIYLYLYLYIYIYIYLYIYIWIHMYTHTHTHIYIYIYTHTYIYIYKYICLFYSCFFTYACIYPGGQEFFDYLMYVSCLKTFCGVAECPEARVTWPG